MGRYKGSGRVIKKMSNPGRCLRVTVILNVSGRE